MEVVGGADEDSVRSGARRNAEVVGAKAVGPPGGAAVIGKDQVAAGDHAPSSFPETEPVEKDGAVQPQIQVLPFQLRSPLRHAQEQAAVPYDNSPLRIEAVNGIEYRSLRGGGTTAPQGVRKLAPRRSAVGGSFRMGAYFAVTELLPVAHGHAVYFIGAGDVGPDVGSIAGKNRRVERAFRAGTAVSFHTSVYPRREADGRVRKADCRPHNGGRVPQREVQPRSGLPRLPAVLRELDAERGIPCVACIAAADTFVRCVKRDILIPERVVGGVHALPRQPVILRAIDSSCGPRYPPYASGSGSPLPSPFGPLRPHLP